MRIHAMLSWSKKLLRPLLSVGWIALGLAVGLGLGLTQASRAQGYDVSGSSIIQAGAASALGTDFTYQGQLKDAGAPANGSYDFEFRLYDAENLGNLVGSPNTVSLGDQQVANGLFTVALNFGSSAFTGDARWLEVSVRPGASAGAYTALTPRQTVAAVPYALHALTASSPAMRAYYLSTSGFTGSQALTACISGYHMASMWEIFDLGGLRYATELPQAFKFSDSGFGPPLSSAGWIRTGTGSNAGTQIGVANCNVWASSSNADNGTRANINPGVVDPAKSVSPWDMTLSACNVQNRVWCVQDYP